jgi:hypothetical protein
VKKTWHFVVLVLAIVGAFAVYHMYQHHGVSIAGSVPGLGSK